MQSLVAPILFSFSSNNNNDFSAAPGKWYFCLLHPMGRLNRIHHKEKQLHLRSHTKLRRFLMYGYFSTGKSCRPPHSVQEPS